MKSHVPKNYHLNDNQRYFIKYQLSKGLTPIQIIKEWDEEFHQRKAPSEQKIYKIKELHEKGVSVKKRKSGPKNKTVLTPQKINEIQNVVDGDPFITNRAISELVEIPKSTVNDGLKTVHVKKFRADVITTLTEEQKLSRKSFCGTFLCWNIKYQLTVWWSDESTFKVEEMFKHVQRSYYGTENMHLQIEKKKRKKSVKVWAAIRGDGNVVYEVLEGKQNSKKYIQILNNKIHEMEPHKSFFMQDGASIHHSLEDLEWFNIHWKDRWIGLGSEKLEWPPYSPDLTPMDFSFWSWVKRRVALYYPESYCELKKAIDEVMNNLPKQEIINMCMEVRDRCKKCRENNGERFEKEY